MTSPTIKISIPISTLVEAIALLDSSQRALLKQLLDEDKSTAQLAKDHLLAQDSQSYPLRDLPISISKDFDEPMLQTWDAR